MGKANDSYKREKTEIKKKNKTHRTDRGLCKHLGIVNILSFPRKKKRKKVPVHTT